MAKRIAIVGLDAALALRVVKASKETPETWDINALLYPSVPRITNDDTLRVESPTVADRMLDVAGVIYYSYFDGHGIEEDRLTLALSDTPTFPDVRAAQPLDNKLVALVAALRSDPLRAQAPNRRVVRSETYSGMLSDKELKIIAEHPDSVIKSGNTHCGENKYTTEEFIKRTPPSGSIGLPGPIYIEPFIDGDSVRVLIVGTRAWQLRYTSSDWRKNVNSTITIMDIDEDLLARTKRIVSGLGLLVAGVDYIIPKKGAPVLLEVNAYPGLDDVHGAEDEFVELAALWVKSVYN